MCLCNMVLALCNDKNVSSLSVSAPLDKNSLLRFSFLFGGLRSLSFHRPWCEKTLSVYVGGFSLLDKRDIWFYFVVLLRFLWLWRWQGEVTAFQKSSEVKFNSWEEKNWRPDQVSLVHFLVEARKVFERLWLPSYKFEGWARKDARSAFPF